MRRTWRIAAISLFILALAARNLRTNRADRRGAALVAATMTLTGILAWVFGAHHSLAIEAEYRSLFRAAGTTLVVTSLVWPMYLALEPYVRRLWPDSLLGWSRLTSGHVHDPRVGHDVLVGAVVGVAVALLAAGRASIIPWLGYPAPVPVFGEDVYVLLGPGAVISATLLSLFGALEAALIAVLIVVFIRLAVRWTWLSITISVALLSLPFLDEAGTTSTSLVLAFALASGAILTYVVFRAGLLALAAALFVYIALMNVPFMPEIAHWAAPAGHWTMIIIIVLVAFGFYASRAGQPLWGGTENSKRETRN